MKSIGPRVAKERWRGREPAVAGQRRHLATVLLAAGLLAALPSAWRPALAAAGDADERPETSVTTAVSGVSTSDVARVRDAVYPSLVNITVVNQRFADGKTQRFPGAGSGVLVTPDGHVLTNFHVAGNTTRIWCTLTDGRVFPAEVVVGDPLTDLAVLRLLAPPGEPLPHAAFGDSRALEVGEPVFAMGNPLAMASSMTQGIVSNAARVFTDFTGTEMQELTLGEDELSGLLTRWIQHDALILPGNSGGPLVNLAGEVVGVNALGGRGLGFAIPSEIAFEVLEQALAHGRVERGWLGFSVLPVGKIGRREGALVSSVLAETPARRAGLEPGDILLSLAGEEVVVRFFEEVPLLYQRIARLPPGERVAMTVERGGAVLALEARTELMEPFRGEEAEVRELGVTLQEITAPMALVRGLASREGVLLTGIRPGGATDGARPRLAPEDVLLALDGAHLASVADVRRAVAVLERGEDLLVEVRRRQESLLAVVPAPRQPAHGWGGELPKAWLGVRTQVLTNELAAELGTPGRTGFRVTQVFPQTEAARAGLRPGDVLIALDGTPLDASRLQESDDLRRRVEELYIGETAELQIVRGDEERRVEVTLEPRPAEADEVPRARQEELEFAVRAITFHDRVRHGWDPDVEGVVVTEAARGGWAQMAGLRLDDLIQQVGDRRVAGLPDFQHALEATLEERPPVVKIFLRRGFRTHFVLIEPDWEEIFPAASESAAGEGDS